MLLLSLVLGGVATRGCVCAGYEAHLGSVAEHRAQRFPEPGQMVLVNPIDEERVRNLELDFSGAEAQGMDRFEPGFECLLAADSSLHHREHFFPESAGILQLRGLRGHFQLSLPKRSLVLPAGLGIGGVESTPPQARRGDSIPESPASVSTISLLATWQRLVVGKPSFIHPFSTMMPRGPCRAGSLLESKPVRTVVTYFVRIDCVCRVCLERPREPVPHRGGV